MPKLSRKALGATGIAALVVGFVFFIGSIVNSQPPIPPSTTTTPPANQSYIGVKRCSSCHFKEYMTWKKTEHFTKAWPLVPAKYRTAAECVVCHTTGYGTPTGFKDEASSPNLVGTTCEACHGPGSAHEAACKPFLNEKTLSDEQKKIAHGTIYKIQPGNVCVACHTIQGHAAHPKYDQQ
jgi:hypothetical protein